MKTLSDKKHYEEDGDGIMFNLPKVEIIKLVDVKDVDWCEEAVLFRVKSGKGTLTHRISEEDEDYR